MQALSRANQPTNEIVRRLAIIIQGEIISAPNLNGVIGGRLKIEGNFSHEFVQQIVRKVRSAGQ